MLAYIGNPRRGNSTTLQYHLRRAIEIGVAKDKVVKDVGGIQALIK